MPYESELEIMMRAARQAGETALRYFNDRITVEEKEDHSPVTAADRECEKLICRLLSDAFPQDGILGEEGAFRTSSSQRRWLIDPIDGTRDFVRHNSYWSIQIALESEKQIVLGVIHFPCLNETLYAIAGAGCFWNGMATRASCTDQIEKAILMISGLKTAWTVWPPDGLRLMTETCWTVRSHGASYDIAMLARGNADIWLSGAGRPWDYAPARVIAQEAGARFLTNDGTGRIDAGHCVICVPGLEAEVRRILKIGMPGSAAAVDSW